MRVVLALAAMLPLCMPGQTPKAPVQPVPFGHRQHAAAKIACKQCHPNAARAERAGLPSAAQCMACHTSVKKESPGIQQLADFHKEEKPVPWARVYRLPDFVFFSHATHVNAGVECAECHGAVEQRETLSAEIVHNMKTCMACHQTRNASNKCHVCHELGQ